MATETVERAGELVTDADPAASRAAAFDLPVPDLQIRGFRGIDSLDIPRFTQVTLIAGLNGIGKTTVLEALEVLASRGLGDVLTGILVKRREQGQAIDEQGRQVTVLDWESLFYGRSPNEDDVISISIKDNDESLRISVATAEDIENDGAERILGGLDPEIAILMASMNGARKYLPMTTERRGPYLWRRRRAPFEAGYPAELQYETVGPDVLRDDQLASMWDDIALSPELREVTTSVTKMFGRQIKVIAMTGGEGSSSPGRRAMVSLDEGSRPVPLKSLGDGAMRITGNIMSISRSDTCLVLVDEIENGLHHSIQRQFWSTMIDAAARNDTQLVATTHSWDCVEAFAHAAVENESVDCSLIRLDDIGDELTVAMYDESNLLSATESGIEVR